MTPANVVAVPVDERALRRTLSRFCTGVVVVASMDGPTPVGLTCQSFVPLSLDPPLVMFAAGRLSASWPRIRDAGRFAVSVLRADQEPVSRALAVNGPDKFAAVSWRAGVAGCPLVDGALAHIECALDAVHGGGDHDIVVGRVSTLHVAEPADDPLLYYASEYRRLGPRHR